MRKNKVTVWVEALSAIMQIINQLGLRRRKKTPYAILMVEHTLDSHVIRVHSETEYNRVTFDVDALDFPVLADSRDKICQSFGK